MSKSYRVPAIIQMIINSLFYILLTCCSQHQKAEHASPIDRHAVVIRHNVNISEPDTLGSLTVGNGKFAFTVDVTGLQTFPQYYENGIALGTQSQWGWHSFPDTGHYTIADVAEAFESCNDKTVPYAVQHSEGRARDASHYLRTNPHRLHLGLIGLVLLKENGEEVAITDLQHIDQQLDLWAGKIESHYTIEGVPVSVALYSHPVKDQIAVRIHSPLMAQGRLHIRFQFPYGNDCHVCAGYDWKHPEKHQSQIVSQQASHILLQRILDTTRYFVQVGWQQEGAFSQKQPHHFILTPSREQDSFEFNVLFSPEAQDSAIADFAATQQQSEQHWQAFWQQGGVIDFSACTDPRAKELERRVVLSQYLTKIQCAGSMPPQETGLTMNSWYGKFHLEMHWWHGTHFALWNRLDLLEKSMAWYQQAMPEARATAQWQGYEGVRWQKMTGPDGRKSPSSVGELLIWQQPHPLYFAELIYRQKPYQETLEKYKDIVFQTAAFMASFAQYNVQDQQYHLCHPLIPAQEIFLPLETDDPPFELAYWHYGLSVAQQWRERLGLPRQEKWQQVLNHLAALPVKDSLYLPTAHSLEAYAKEEYQRDHPVVLGAYGMLPGKGMVDTALMKHTFETILEQWQWKTTWGWDYPMMAMAAARLGKPEEAINALLMEMPKNTYLVNGHNYQDQRLRLYLPGNGGLLTAVAMMAAGWDGAPDIPNPGFPKNSQWHVRWEGLQPLP